MEQWEKPAGHRSQVEIDVHFLWGCDERNYVKMLGTFIRDHIEGYKRPPRILCDSLLSVPYKTLPLLTSASILPDALKYEAKYRSSVEQAYFLGCHNREFLMKARKEQVMLYAKVPCRWGKYQSYRGMLVLTSPLFSFGPSLFFND